jgi:hypothetical protein
MTQPPRLKYDNIAPQYNQREEQIVFRNELRVKMFTGFKPGASL